MKKGRHVLIVRQDVVHEQRNAADILCFEGITGVPDQRHGPEAKCLTIRLQPGEKALIANVQLLYCSNDTDKEWRFQLEGELWDNHTWKTEFCVPAKAKGHVPSLDRLLFRNERLAKWPDLVQYLGQEYSIMGAHSTCVNPTEGGGFQLFRGDDPFLQFLRRHWNLFKGLSDLDIALINSAEKESEQIYQVSQPAIERATRYFRTVFEEVHYKCKETPFRLITKESKFDLASIEQGSGSFSGVVILLSLDYIVVSPAAPKCRVMDYPLNLII